MKVYSFPLPSSMLLLKLEKKELSYMCSSLLRVGQSRLMPRAERRVIECFVWRADPAKHS